MKNSILYHDGCDICALANLDIVHIGLNPLKQIEAESKGVKAFPALVLNNGNILHFNVEEHEGSVDCLF